MSKRIRCQAAGNPKKAGRELPQEGPAGCVFFVVRCNLRSLRERIPFHPFLPCTSYLRADVTLLTADIKSTGQKLNLLVMGITKLKGTLDADEQVQMAAMLVEAQEAANATLKAHTVSVDKVNETEVDREFALGQAAEASAAFLVGGGVAAGASTQADEAAAVLAEWGDSPAPVAELPALPAPVKLQHEPRHHAGPAYAGGGGGGGGAPGLNQFA